MSTEKACAKCAEVKPLAEFYRNWKARDGRSYTCITCQKAYGREWYAANIEGERVRRESRKGEVAQQRKAHREANIELYKERDATNRNTHPHRGWASQYRVRAQKYGITPTEEKFTKTDVIERYGDSCFYCETGAFENIDHAIPVAKGGTHTLDNVRPSCFPCNRAKSVMTEDEWLAKGGAR